MIKLKSPFLFISGFIVATIVFVLIGTTVDKSDSTEDTEMRDTYYPGTEELKPDEMRVIALGTGMPNARPKQAAACWLVELGNGDKFLFDIGTGSAERIFSFASGRNPEKILAPSRSLMFTARRMVASSSAMSSSRPVFLWMPLRFLWRS